MKDLELPNYNIVDWRIEPSEVKMPRGQDLSPEAVIAARMHEVQDLINLKAFEWVRKEDVGPSGK